MIRKLTEDDCPQTLAFLKPQAAINLFLIGDLEHDGFDQPFQEFWGSFNPNNDLEAVLLRYDKSYIPYSPNENFDFTPFIDLIKKDTTHHLVSGKGSIIKRIQPFFPNYTAEITYFCELKEAPTPTPCPYEIKIAKPKDALRISDFLNDIEEFQMSSTDPHQLERVISSHSGRIYYTETPDGTIRNVVQSTAENSLSAMIVGVATHKDFRHQGLMKSCLSQLCYDLIHHEKKSLCLFYDNPEAGKIYHHLGFKTIDDWSMLYKS